MFIVKPSVTFIWATPHALTQIELAGRTCDKIQSKLTRKSAADVIKKILERGHDSVLEHAVASFRIICDRGVTHEIVRHRIASYSQESTRFCCYLKTKFGGSITVIKPPGMTPAQIRIWRNSCEIADLAYAELIKSGCTPQIARSVLPTCLKTEIVMTANFREWRHFIKLRTAKNAHPQMIEVANKIDRMLRNRFAPVFGRPQIPERLWESL